MRYLLPLATVLLPFAASAQEDGPFPPPEPWLDGLLHTIARGIELAGIALIVVGAIVASAVYLGRLVRREAGAYQAYRADLGRGILLGLEFLVAADIVGTVAVEPSLENLGILAVIVLIRTFLSFTLEVEIEGRWPWQARCEPADAKRPTP